MKTDNVIFTPADVTSEEGVNSALNTVKEKFGKLNVAISCAGDGVACKTFDMKSKKLHSLKDFTRVRKDNYYSLRKVLKCKINKRPLLEHLEINNDKMRSIEN